MQAAKELNYTPDKLKKNKKPDMSKAIIGIVVGSVLNSFFNRIISGITKEFERYNYHIIVLYCNGDPLKMHKKPRITTKAFLPMQLSLSQWNLIVLK